MCLIVQAAEDLPLKYKYLFSAVNGYISKELSVALNVLYIISCETYIAVTIQGTSLFVYY
jgi:hypothetical protein